MNALSCNKALCDLDLLAGPPFLQFHLEVEVSQSASQSVPDAISVQVKGGVEQLLHASLDEGWAELLVSRHNVSDCCSSRSLDLPLFWMLPHARCDESSTFTKSHQVGAVLRLP